MSTEKFVTEGTEILTIVFRCVEHEFPHSLGAQNAFLAESCDVSTQSVRGWRDAIKTRGQYGSFPKSPRKDSLLCVIALLAEKHNLAKDGKAKRTFSKPPGQLVLGDPAPSLTQKVREAQKRVDAENQRREDRRTATRSRAEAERRSSEWIGFMGKSEDPYGPPSTPRSGARISEKTSSHIDVALNAFKSMTPGEKDLFVAFIEGQK
jgi:hypothetical protein